MTYDNHEFEIITDKVANFKAFVNVLRYRSPHMHADFEIGLVLDGSIEIRMDNNTYMLEAGDFVCLNPYHIHELSSEENAVIIFIQVSPVYFSYFYQEMQYIEFKKPYLKKEDTKSSQLARLIIELGKCYMEKTEHFELKFAGLLNVFFYNLLQSMPHDNIQKTSQEAPKSKLNRLRSIADYVEKNCDQKLLLSDIAKREGLTLSYMSHFFKDNFYLSFQEYLMKLRCEKARQMLLMTDLKLLDISISCGFSDIKYFNQGFKKQFGCTPKQYKAEFGHKHLTAQQTSMLTTQQIMSAATGLILLEKFQAPYYSEAPADFSLL